ncbi:MAG: hypothetical protein KBG50_11675, partial [Ruthenibacterium sp.]|nr:hypothetical protein [Ruthenibacterium sp.]
IKSNTRRSSSYAVPPGKARRTAAAKKSEFAAGRGALLYIQKNTGRKDRCFLSCSQNARPLFKQFTQ